MANATLLESMRSAAEEIEAIEMAIVEELESVQRKSHKSKLAQEVRLRNLLTAASERAKRIKPIESQPQGGLTEFYRRKEQLEATMRDENSEATIGFDDDPQMVARLCAFGGEIPTHDEEDERSLWKPRNRLERREARARIDEFVLSHEPFTGEEHLGRYLDLHESHFEFQNLHPTYAKTTYLEYLRTRLFEIPPSIPDVDSAAYGNYLVNLRTYLKEFESRALPLSALRAEENESNEEKPFESALKNATAPGDLEVLGLADLKIALENRGLKASGTLSQRAARLFAVKNLSPDQYPLELLSIAGSRQQQTASGSGKDVKKDEMQVRQLLDRLKPLIQATQAMVNKKLTMTYEEIEQELRDEERDLEAVERSDDEAEADEDDEKKPEAHGVIDPSTGRLIPKWKFRLYGLNQEFKCEICGNLTYFGRKAFEKHFTDYRHANGMRALGIPNTAHFHDITQIEDAKKLYEKLRKDLEKGEFNRSNEEEFEDSQGNVMSRSAYEDLKREGLL